MNYIEIIKKYTVPVPRYTSYPTVPYWESKDFSVAKWTIAVSSAFEESNQNSGISLYIHLPYCESLCTYCGCNTRITKNHEVEKPYIKAVAKEWQLYKKLFKSTPKIKELHLGGGTPTFFSPAHLKALIEDILEGCELHPDAEFSFEAHPGNTSKEHLVTLYQLGFKRLSLGIQDFDIKVQQIINRIQSEEEVLTVTNQARALGYHSINYDLIYGLPLQTVEGLVATMNKVIALQPDRIAFYNYAHVPWVKPGQRMFTEQDLPNAEAKQLLYEVGRNLLIAHGYKEIGMDHFALIADSLYKAQIEGNLHRNFMGYTHQYTQLMIGLGVSSISDTWFAFAQNVKKVEEYLALIDKGELPVFRGHFLNEDDLIIRKHILNIMCKGETSWDKLDLLNDDFKEGLQRLEELEKDKLIIRGDYSLKVTAAGERFLRNICAAFDARLWAKEPEKQVFSMG
ncbi:oxygen-independent coproporphyrinogen III oxidase [Pedobacter cryophilus]|uniref:Coproporphyrinogen-III oxidase n=1 Tax=Pedobacter cryophilus TaxID=2571271 RepID=A0A4V5NZZ3_9SPHI|nr:oxygen-independent coproporphyrinogen III oxidase [Pedobacter cryophilus]TKB99123.1 oxygen-independent coproporphyrinogen III oxidase [Pedobacter cryophilus]